MVASESQSLEAHFRCSGLSLGFKRSGTKTFRDQDVDRRSYRLSDGLHYTHGDCCACVTSKIASATRRGLAIGFGWGSTCDRFACFCRPRSTGHSYAVPEDDDVDGPEP